MARYTSKLRQNKNGKPSYSTYYNLDKVYQRRDTDQYFIAQEGDRCDTLASRFYGDVNLWWYIARVNSLKSMNIPAGTHLRIPQISI
jgi:hypothetical protein